MAQNYSSVSGTDQSRILLTSSLPDRDEALRTMFSGNSAPSNPVAYQLWAQPSTKSIWQRNAANSAWVFFAPLGGNAGRLSPTRGMGAMAAATNLLFVAPAPLQVVRALIVSPTATTGSTASIEWTFMLKNHTTGLNLFSALPGTGTDIEAVGGGEIAANTVYELLADQNVLASAGDVLQFIVAQEGSPTAIANWLLQLDCFEIGP